MLPTVSSSRGSQSYGCGSICRLTDLLCCKRRDYAGLREPSCCALAPAGESHLAMHGTPQETDNPDLRDRAYVYWRLLSSDPEAARAVVLAEKPVISQARWGFLGF